MVFTVDEILKSVQEYDELPELDYKAQCAESFPDDVYLMEEVNSPKAQEERYGLIVWMNSEAWRYR